MRATFLALLSLTLTASATAEEQVESPELAAAAPEAAAPDSSSGDQPHTRNYVADHHDIFAQFAHLSEEEMDKVMEEKIFGWLSAYDQQYYDKTGKEHPLKAMTEHARD